MAVEIPCPCPPKGGETRHPDGDTVTLKETLDFRSVTAIRTNIGLLEDGHDIGDIMAVLTEGYLIHGIESWSLVDEKGKALPVTRANINDVILTRIDVASVLGDAADDAFGEKVVLPLLNRAVNSLPPTPTEPTSAPSQASTGSSARPKRSKPSSTTTSQTDGIGSTFSPPDGDFNSSRSSTQAG